MKITTTVRDEHRPATASSDWEEIQVFTKAEALAFARVAVEATLAAKLPEEAEDDGQIALAVLKRRARTILARLAERIDEVRRRGPVAP